MHNEYYLIISEQLNLREIKINLFRSRLVSTHTIHIRIYHNCIFFPFYLKINNLFLSL